MKASKEYDRSTKVMNEALKEAEQRNKAAASKDQLKKPLTVNTSNAI